ncbi:RNA polymerase sigma factor for flagellar operon FliA [Sedimentibacter acidaminivorans]|uniref:RNA polymerase sigma factor for flagellar operon FliA n=1 Tax=Sedimentibacter acidaminivorans TaxID=913099 RepID=A0ABS4GDF8_9FIRM|nr:FliA/WhiG family RNA polymerase sigma factor [Sedimentibacter acidaminivorans]MBP1925733.1 RNA polymerase sigma factor for flagellar operon FliA [Sedimentibacter acidaminivorans]
MKEIQPDNENLWERYAETKDIAIRNQIIEKYSYLVKIIALKIRGVYEQYGDVDDVINEGIIALIDIIDKFDISKNVKFETYATIRVKGAIIDYVRKQDWTPRKVKTDAKILSQAEKELNIKLGRTPNDNEIAEFLQIDMEEYNQIVRNTLGTSIMSFEELVGEANLRDREIKYDYELPEDIYETKELSKVLKESINQLKEKEKLVISLYYKEEIKLKDISKILNISNSRASQIHSMALEKLKKSIKEYLQDKI